MPVSTLSYVGVDRKKAEFISNKQIHSLTHSQTLNFILGYYLRQSMG